ncbi:MAG: transposase [Nitrososphaerota archaeon]|nr:transposase [Nitrososphaerota archaeon]
MPRQALLQEFSQRVVQVRSRAFPYRSKQKPHRSWSDYDQAQEHEYPEVLGLIRVAVDEASKSYNLVRHDATGRGGYSSDKIARLILAQQYDGRSDRVSVGYLRVVGKRIGASIPDMGYKTLENAYSDYDVMAIINDVFFLTQQPVLELEHIFSLDGTCFSNTLKANWESTKERLMKKSTGKKGHHGRRQGVRKKKQFEKAVLAAGTTFKIITSFVTTGAPNANESPYLKPLFLQIVELYDEVKLMTGDAAYPSRRNCSLIASHGAVPRLFPRKNSTFNSKGSSAWRTMLEEFLNDTQKWLELYHERSKMETINSTTKRIMPAPVRKRLVMRKATEIAARICVYNLRQLVYLKYTKRIDPTMIWTPKYRPVLPNYLTI